MPGFLDAWGSGGPGEDDGDLLPVAASPVWGRGAAQSPQRRFVDPELLYPDPGSTRPRGPKSSSPLFGAPAPAPSAERFGVGLSSRGSVPLFGAPAPRVASLSPPLFGGPAPERAAPCQALDAHFAPAAPPPHRYSEAAQVAAAAPHSTVAAAPLCTPRGPWRGQQASRNQEPGDDQAAPLMPEGQRPVPVYESYGTPQSASSEESEGQESPRDSPTGRRPRLQWAAWQDGGLEADHVVAAPAPARAPSSGPGTHLVDAATADPIVVVPASAYGLPSGPCVYPVSPAWGTDAFDARLPASRPGSHAPWEGGNIPLAVAPAEDEETLRQALTSELQSIGERLGWQADERMRLECERDALVAEAGAFTAEAFTAEEELKQSARSLAEALDDDAGGSVEERRPALAIGSSLRARLETLACAVRRLTGGERLPTEAEVEAWSQELASSVQISEERRQAVELGEARAQEEHTRAEALEEEVRCLRDWLSGPDSVASLPAGAGAASTLLPPPEPVGGAAGSVPCSAAGSARRRPRTRSPWKHRRSGDDSLGDAGSLSECHGACAPERAKSLPATHTGAAQLVALRTPPAPIAAATPSARAPLGAIPEPLPAVLPLSPPDEGAVSLEARLRLLEDDCAKLQGLRQRWKSAIFELASSKQQY